MPDSSRSEFDRVRKEPNPHYRELIEEARRMGADEEALVDGLFEPPGRQRGDALWEIERNGIHRITADNLWPDE